MENDLDTGFGMFSAGRLRDALRLWVDNAFLGTAGVVFFCTRLTFLVLLLVFDLRFETNSKPCQFSSGRYHFSLSLISVGNAARKRAFLRSAIPRSVLQLVLICENRE